MTSFSETPTAAWRRTAIGMSGVCTHIPSAKICAFLPGIWSGRCCKTKILQGDCLAINLRFFDKMLCTMSGKSKIGDKRNQNCRHLMSRWITSSGPITEFNYLELNQFLLHEAFWGVGSVAVGQLRSRKGYSAHNYQVSVIHQISTAFPQQLHSPAP